MNLEDVILLFEISKSQTGIAGFHLHKVLGVVKIVKTGNIMVISGEGEGELLLNEYKVSVLQDERIMGTDGGNGCITMDDDNNF